MKRLVLVLACWAGESLKPDCSPNSFFGLEQLWSRNHAEVSDSAKALAILLIACDATVAWSAIGTGPGIAPSLKKVTLHDRDHLLLDSAWTRREALRLLFVGTALLPGAALAAEQNREIELPVRPKKKLQILQKVVTFPKTTDLLEIGEYMSKDRTGAYVWPGGADMARGASTGQLPMSKDGSVKPVVLKDKRLLELGCGTGVAGIGAMIGGARSIVLTDGDPEIVELAQKNADRNLNGGRATAKVLRWGNSDDEADVSKAGPFDIVYAAEVAYESNALAAMFDTTRRFLEEATLAGVADPFAVIQLVPATADSGRGLAGVLDMARKRKLSMDASFPVDDSVRFTFSLAKPST